MGSNKSQKKIAAAAAGGALAALAISVAAPATAEPRVASDDTALYPDHADAHWWYNKPGQTHYGSYQNDNTRQSGARR